ncbi:YhzD family protein [Sporosarcina sp. FA9]|uniref:YhzD family protein n=1 Tax=Sporosarcina sp. FA9 TaxID=3413030 RepID=UPI003F6560BE
MILVKFYKLTAFEPKGELIMDDTLEAATDEEAKVKGHAILEEKNLLEKTHRLASPKGKLLLFHS